MDVVLLEEQKLKGNKVTNLSMLMGREVQNWIT